MQCKFLEGVRYIFVPDHPGVCTRYEKTTRGDLYTALAEPENRVPLEFSPLCYKSPRVNLV